MSKSLYFPAARLGENPDRVFYYCPNCFHWNRITACNGGNMKTRDMVNNDPVMICPACMNTERFSMKTVLKYRGKEGKYNPVNAEEAYRFLALFSGNIVYINKRMVGSGARLPFSQHYGPRFIQEYNNSMHIDISFMHRIDIREDFPGLLLYGGLIYCQACATQALNYDTAIGQCLYSECPGCTICNIVTDDPKRAIEHCAEYCRNSADSGSQETCHYCRYRILQNSHGYSWAEVRNLIYQKLQEEAR